MFGLSLLEGPIPKGITSTGGEADQKTSLAFHGRAMDPRKLLGMVRPVKPDVNVSKRDNGTRRHDIPFIRLAQKRRYFVEVSQRCQYLRVPNAFFTLRRFV